MKKNGFTLAETLITIGIVGVIMAITLPILNKARPNEEMVMFQKAYFNTARVVSELINDDDLYPEREEEDENSGFANISIADITGGKEAVFRGEEYFGPRKFCALFAAKMNVTNTNCDQNVSLANGGNFMTPDGIVWSLPVGDFSEIGYIGIDTNGSRGDNCTPNEVPTTATVCPNLEHKQNQKPDQFFISINKFGEIHVIGDIANEYIRTKKTAKTYEQIWNCLQENNCR